MDSQTALPIPTHTDEVRELLESGQIKPGHKALDLPVDSMTDRELLIEALIHARNTRDAVTALIEGINASPIGKMIAGGGNPLAMFGGSAGSGDKG